VLAAFVGSRRSVFLISTCLTGMAWAHGRPPGRRTDDTFLPIVVVADTTPAAATSARAGAADFLTEPFDGVEVILRARNLLAARRLHQHTREQTAVLEAKLEENQAEQRRVVRERSERTALVRQRLEGRGLAVHLQPIVDLESGRVVGAEALARFAPPPLRPPNHWFAAARSVGLGRELELAAVDVALTNCRCSHPTSSCRSTSRRTRPSRQGSTTDSIGSTLRASSWS
jgi:hypothetical protein